MLQPKRLFLNINILWFRKAWRF